MNGGKYRNQTPLNKSKKFWFPVLRNILLLRPKICSWKRHKVLSFNSIQFQYFPNISLFSSDPKSKFFNKPCVSSYTKFIIQLLVVNETFTNMSNYFILFFLLYVCIFLIALVCLMYKWRQENIWILWKYVYQKLKYGFRIVLSTELSFMFWYYDEKL